MVFSATSYLKFCKKYALSIFIPELKFIKEMKCQSLKTAAEHVEAKSSILNTISESMLLTII
jgi:hypothetical protein